MSENVNGGDIFGSGGRQWNWSSPPVFEKKLGTAGTTGEVGILTHVGSAVVRIAGLLKAADDAALDVLETIIEQFKVSRLVCTWEDDAGHTGETLVIIEYQRTGARQYGKKGGVGVVWQTYVVLAEERLGGPFI